MNPRNAALSHEAARADAVAPDAVVPAAGDVPDAVVAEGATRPDAVVAQSPVPGAAVPSDAVPHAAVPSAPVQPRTLAAAGVTLAYGDRVVSEGLDLTITPGAVTAIVGANGCGKSTLLRALARLLAPQQGEVLLDGEPVRKRHTKEVARIVGLLPQSPIAPEGIAVADLVGRGRYPHQRAFAGWSAADYAAVADALAATDTTDLADRAVDELSGGQRQRVWIAMALAQQTDILLLDEPTTFLDVAHQVEVLDLLTDLNHERGTTIVMVLHDLNMAARYADVLVTMREGAVHSVGVPSEIVTAQLVEEVFGMRSQVIPDPVSGKPLVLPAGRHHGG